MEEITIVEVPTTKVAGITRTGPYKTIAELMPVLYHHLIGKGVQPTGPPVFVCHEMEVEQVMDADKNGTAQVEVAVPVASEVPETDEIKNYELPGGKMAKTIHKGPYEDCGPTYERFYKWIAEQGLKITGPTRECYLNDPREVGSDEILTEIYAPVE